MLLTPTPTSETTTILDKPLSQLSISPRKPKKTKKTITTPPPPAATATAITTTATIISNQENEPSTSCLEKFIPRYLKVPDRIFKQMLSNSIENGYLISRCLDGPEKLQFVRQITEMTNNLYFKDFQRQLWQEYYNLSSKDKNWVLKITKQYAHQHHTCRMYRPQKSFIEERQSTITHQIKRIGDELREHLIKLQQNITQWRPSINFDLLSHAINECVKNSQQRLKDEFNYKKEMLTLDWIDHQSLTEFYQLKPDEEVIQFAKTLWQAAADELKMKEQLEILRQRISLKRLPTKTDQMVNQLLDDHEITLSNPFIEKDQRANFTSRCSKTIIQCKFNLMVIQLDEFETIIRRHHSTLTSLQEKLSKLNKEKPRLYTNLLIDAIEQRRQAMMQRFIRLRQHKLKTFFDEAPTMDDN